MIMEWKVFKVVYNHGRWHSGELPHFYYIARSEEEVIANSTSYAHFIERQESIGGDIWIHEFDGIDYPSEWENLKDFDVCLTVKNK